MKTTVLAFTIALLALTGCVSAHKKASTTHERWQYEVVPSTNGSPVALLIDHEVWTDSYRGGGEAFFADPQASQLDSEHSNQTALGGTSSLSVGSISSTVSTNGIRALGGAIKDTGEGVGDAAKAFVK